MTDKKNLNNLQLNLCSFSNGVNQFYFHPLFRTIQYSDGVKYFM